MLAECLAVILAGEGSGLSPQHTRVTLLSVSELMNGLGRFCSPVDYSSCVSLGERHLHTTYLLVKAYHPPFFAFYTYRRFEQTFN